jgi:hypothetical protein
MGNRKSSLIIILLANFILLAFMTISHHHHNASTTDQCDLKTAVVLPQDKHDSQPTIQTFTGLFLLHLFEKRYEAAAPFIRDVNAYSAVTSSYPYFVSTASGLRAPPLV